MLTDRGNRAEELDPPTCDGASGGGLLVDDAFARQHTAFVRRSLVRLRLTGGDLEDGIQDVFLAALRGAERFDTGRSVRGWLYGIAVNIAREQRKKRWRRERTWSEPRETGVPATQERHLEVAEARSLIHRALDELPSEQRDVIILYRLEGLPMNDVAEAMGCPLDTAHSRLRLGTQRLGRFVRRSAVRGRWAALLAALASALGMPPTAAAATASALAVVLVVGAVSVANNAPGHPPLSPSERVDARESRQAPQTVVRAEARDRAPEQPLAAEPARHRDERAMNRATPRAPRGIPVESASPPSAAPETTPAATVVVTDDAAGSTSAALREEAQLLARVRVLAGASPDRARELLTTYDQRFPRGQLRHERDVIATRLSVVPAP